jgi:hypothetical protein
VVKKLAAVLLVHVAKPWKCRRRIWAIKRVCVLLYLMLYPRNVP